MLIIIAICAALQHRIPDRRRRTLFAIIIIRFGIIHQTWAFCEGARIRMQIFVWRNKRTHEFAYLMDLHNRVDWLAIVWFTIWRMADYSGVGFDNAASGEHSIIL